MFTTILKNPILENEIELITSMKLRIEVGQDTGKRGPE